VEVHVSNHKFFGKTLNQLDFRKRFGLNVVAIKKAAGNVVVSPEATELVEERDILVVIGSTRDVEILNDKMNV
jgi:trk system potassium uptake protein TrkA